MTQFLRCSKIFRYENSDLQRLLFCLLSGSLIGALCVGLSDYAVSVPRAGWSSASPPYFSYARCALFPILLFTALVLRRKLLFWVLFFLKGAAAAYTVCYLAAIRSAAIGVCFFDTVLVLPFWFYLGAVWLNQTESTRPAGFLLIPALFPAFFCAILRDQIF